eukprot:842088-Prorocentrum_minimum.AAC.1
MVTHASRAECTPIVPASTHIRFSIRMLEFFGKHSPGPVYYSPIGTVDHGRVLGRGFSWGHVSRIPDYAPDYDRRWWMRDNFGLVDESESDRCHGMRPPTAPGASQPREGKIHVPLRKFVPSPKYWDHPWGPTQAGLVPPPKHPNSHTSSNQTPKKSRNPKNRNPKNRSKSLSASASAPLPFRFRIVSEDEVDENGKPLKPRADSATDEQQDTGTQSAAANSRGLNSSAQ